MLWLNFGAVKLVVASLGVYLHGRPSAPRTHESGDMHQLVTVSYIVKPACLESFGNSRRHEKRAEKSQAGLKGVVTKRRFRQVVAGFVEVAVPVARDERRVGEEIAGSSQDRDDDRARPSFHMDTKEAHCKKDGRVCDSTRCDVRERIGEKPMEVPSAGRPAEVEI